MSKPLTACPFCGGKKLEMRNFSSDRRYGRVHCLQCTASGPIERHSDEVLEWNSRTTATDDMPQDYGKQVSVKGLLAETLRKAGEK